MRHTRIPWFGVFFTCLFFRTYIEPHLAFNLPTYVPAVTMTEREKKIKAEEIIMGGALGII